MEGDSMVTEDQAAFIEPFTVLLTAAAGAPTPITAQVV